MPGVCGLRGGGGGLFRPRVFGFQPQGLGHKRGLVCVPVDARDVGLAVLSISRATNNPLGSGGDDRVRQ